MVHNQYQEILQTLNDCIADCNHCFDACFQEDDIQMMTECIRLDRECADICSYLVQAITRNSPFIADIAAVCAKICEACGNECKKHNHEHCQKCAESCFACAKACREIAA